MIEDDRGCIAQKYVFECLFNKMEVVHLDGTVGPPLRRVEGPVVVVQGESVPQVDTVQTDEVVAVSPVIEPVVLGVVERKAGDKMISSLQFVGGKVWGTFRRVAASLLLGV